MNYDEMMKAGRISAMREFFQLHGYNPTEDYLEWFYENFLGICKNMGYLFSNDEPLNKSPYAEFALRIYELGH
jgi:hypothetical protein